MTIFRTDIWNFDFDGAIDYSAHDIVDAEGLRVVHLHRESRVQTEVVLRSVQTKAGNVEHLDLDRFLAEVLQIDDKVEGANTEHANLKNNRVLEKITFVFQFYIMMNENQRKSGSLRQGMSGNQILL